MKHFIYQFLLFLSAIIFAEQSTAFFTDPSPTLDALTPVTEEIKTSMQASPHFHEIRSLMDVSDYLEDGDMLFFDVDGTVLVNHQLPEHNFTHFIYALKRLTIPAFGLTSRNTKRKVATHQSLVNEGIDFTYARDLLGLSNKDHTSFFIPHQGFYGGVLSANKIEKPNKIILKGLMLRRFLEMIHHQSPQSMPKRILFIDNNLGQAASVWSIPLHPIQKKIFYLKRPRH